MTHMQLRMLMQPDPTTTHSIRRSLLPSQFWARSMVALELHRHKLLVKLNGIRTFSQKFRSTKLYSGNNTIRRLDPTSMQL